MECNNTDVADLLSGPAIARLLGRERSYIWRQLRRGDFGPTIIGPYEIIFAHRSGVETYLGRTLTSEQISAAVDHQPHRRIVLPNGGAL